MDKLYAKMARHHTVASPYMEKARATSHYLKHGIKNPLTIKQENTDPNAVPAEGAEAAVDTGYVNPYEDAYWELFLLGAINGITSTFNTDCSTGLSLTVSSFFDVIDNIGIYDPRMLGKFQIASVNFTEATNAVYAFCDVSQLAKQFSTLFNYVNWEQYISLAARTGGVFINEFWEKSACISNGNTIGNGFDVGFCALSLASNFLDTKL